MGDSCFPRSFYDHGKHAHPLEGIEKASNSFSYRRRWVNMIKAIALIKRKPGLSREEFSRHYEEVHVPLALKYFPTIKRYVRNYILTPSAVEGPEFDCISEYWYDNIEEQQAAVNFWQSEAGQVIRDDEESFMDQGKTVFFLVEEKVSE
jgi:uncharacterized protein (TIGR02118 family)